MITPGVWQMPVLVLFKYTGNYVNGGFFVFNRALFDYLEDRDDCDLEVGPLDQISQKGELIYTNTTSFGPAWIR